MNHWKVLKVGVKKKLLLLLTGAVVCGQFTVMGTKTVHAQPAVSYDTIVSQAGNYPMKQLGESIREDEANARVMTPEPGTASGTIYYVAADGDDSNSGTTKESPWKSVEKVNSMEFQPGDMILFQANGSWELTEPLYPKGSGTETDRIVIGAYGEGKKPSFSAKNIQVEWDFTDGSKRYASDVLYLENQEYIEIRDLDISNKPEGYTGQESDAQKNMRADRRGIHITGGSNTEETALRGFWLHDLYVHDVVGEANGVSGTGWDPSKRTAGILFEIIVKGENGLPVIANPVDVTGYKPTWFQDVLIEENVLIDNSFGGIIVKQLQQWGARDNSNDAPNYDYDGWYPNHDITIQDNYLDHDGSEYAADTIYLTCTRDSVIRRNVSCGAGTSAIELYFTDRITVEHNEVYRARQKPTGADSNGIDPDKASTNALIQYNYIHECGDGILLCGFIYGSAVVRYNVIQDCSSSKLYLNIHGDKGHNYVYNNIFYNSSNKEAIFVSTSGDKSRYLNNTKNFHYLSNNIFYSPNVPSRIDDGTSVEYKGNNYFQVKEIPAEDEKAVVADPQFADISAIAGGISNDVNLAGLRLKETSPLINAAVEIEEHRNTAIPADEINDFSGSTVSAESGDMGIFEFFGNEAAVGGINGYVFDPYGDTKAGATVTIQSATGSREVVSDERGFYTVYGIPAGSSTVKVSMADYQDTDSIPVEIIGGDIAAADLKLGDSTLTTGSITGNIVNGLGAEVTILDGQGQNTGNTIADENGDFLFEGIPVGSGYTVHVEKTGFQDSELTEIEVKAGYTVVLSDIALIRIPGSFKFLMKEDFNYEAGAFAGNSEWNVDGTGGTVEIVEEPDGNKYLRIAKDSNSGGVKVWNKNPVGAENVFTIEARMKRTEDNGSKASQFAIYSGEKIESSGSINAPMADFGFYQGGKIFIHDKKGSSNINKIASYTKNQWYDVKLVVNMVTDTFDFYIDGVLKKEKAQLRTAGDAINYFSIFSSANNLGDLLIDYLWVYEGDTVDDDTEAASIVVDGLEAASWKYDSGTRAFTTSDILPADCESVKIRVKPASDFTKVTIADTELDRADDGEFAVVVLKPGENRIPFQLTSPAGKTAEYQIIMKRLNESLLAYLTKLDITGLTFSPEFEGTQPAEGEVTYDAGVTSERLHVLTYEVPYAGCSVKVTVNGRTVDGENGSIPFELVSGDNLIVIDVVSESNDEFQIYKIAVCYEESGQREYHTVGIQVTKLPDKLVYETGEMLDSSGIRVVKIMKASSSDAERYENLSEEECRFTYDFSEAGKQKVVVVYEEINAAGEAAEFTAAFTVRVNEPVDETESYTARIGVTKKPNQMVYEKGEAFNPIGMEVTEYRKASPSTASKSNATKRVLDESEYSVTYDFSLAGLRTVIVTFLGTDQNGEEKQFKDSFQVTVKEADIPSPDPDDGTDDGKNDGTDEEGNKTESSGGKKAGSSTDNYGVKKENSIPETTGEWEKDANGTWRFMNHGEPYCATWIVSSGKWYYMDENGIMSSGWTLINQEWYYLSQDTGEMVTGWVMGPQDGYWYYLDSGSGKLLTGWQMIGGRYYYLNETKENSDKPYGALYRAEKTPDGYWVGDDGVWIR